MKIVITVVGHDRVGIVARVAGTCADEAINIIDINQNIMEGFFNMVLIGEMPNTLKLKDVQFKFAQLGSELGLEIRVQSEQIFAAMHHV